MARIKKIDVNGLEVEVDAHKIFETQEEYEKLIQSERSKSKNELLKELGISSVNDGLTKLGAQTQVEELSKKVLELEKQNIDTRNKLYANEIGIKPELVNKCIILANAAMSDGKDYKQVLQEEAESIGAIISKKQDNPDQSNSRRQFGVDKSKEDPKAEAEIEKRMDKFRNM